jgi:hypothetical protein
VDEKLNDDMAANVAALFGRGLFQMSSLLGNLKVLDKKLGLRRTLTWMRSCFVERNLNCYFESMPCSKYVEAVGFCRASFTLTLSLAWLYRGCLEVCV